MINKVILVGNLGRDPIIRYTNDSKPIANFSLATSETFKNKEGIKQEETEWHNCVIFGKLAEIVKSYVKKGSKVYIEGKIKTNKWTDDKTNVTKYKTEIIINTLKMLDKKGENTQPPEIFDEFIGHEINNGPSNSQIVDNSIESDDDIPF